ncbi:oligosaccharide repeat unit polymerase [Lachnospiraceae bacterium PF1-22]|uniref:oligosaccharide repeat unit polymerase n=1 Tax=Ohessyouella blattaphilus TaxID=2949333 RepID=UPI003E18B49E
MFVLNLLIIVSCAILSATLFYKASGTLAVGKINMVSCIYFLFFMQTFLGISLTILGLDKHYTLDKLLYREYSIRITFVIVMLVSIFFPVMICLWQKLLKVKVKDSYSEYLSKKTETKYSSVLFVVIGCGTIILGVLLLIYFVKIGYIPLIRLFRYPKEFDFATERIRINHTIVIHEYITNILVLSVIPLLSYVSFAYMLATKQRKWMVLALILFGMSILVETHNFSKSPVLFYCLILVLIYIYICGGIKTTYMVGFGFFGLILLAIMYQLTGYEGTYFDIYNGPIGRVVFTQVGTLAYAFDLFPSVFGFLNGRSLTPSLLGVLGKDPNLHLRSARVVMEYYGSDKVYQGTAGVMNTVFLGEAYANFGFAGVILSVIVVSIVVVFFFTLCLKLKKTPLMIAFAAVMTVKVGMVSQGGFFDFIYNADWIVTSIIFIGGYLLFESDFKVSRVISEKLKDVLKFNE